MSLKRRIERQLTRAATALEHQRSRAELAEAAARARAARSAPVVSELSAVLRQHRSKTSAQRARLARALAHAQGVFAAAAAAGLQPKQGRQPAGSGGDNTGGRP